MGELGHCFAEIMSDEEQDKDRFIAINGDTKSQT